MGVYDVEQSAQGHVLHAAPTEREPGRVRLAEWGVRGVAFTELSRSGAGLSRFASIGNMADVTHAELIRHLGEDGPTGVIAAFIEGIPDGADICSTRSVTPARQSRW